MAKGQKHSNREVRKPKASKPAAAPATGSLLTRGILASATVPKK
ncbi:hypothetical protein [Kaistia algarum]|nr:hypothetical protein [Kaistia algarum]MCX5513984.1 hypothetical protein [Kaistia algarum]